MPSVDLQGRTTANTAASTPALQVRTRHRLCMHVRRQAYGWETWQQVQKLCCILPAAANAGGTADCMNALCLSRHGSLSLQLKVMCQHHKR